MTDYFQNDDDNTISNSGKSILKKIWKKIYNPVILVAYLLDPRYYGKNLPKNSNSIISKFVQEYYPQNATKIWSITEYKAKRGVFKSADTIACRTHLESYEFNETNEIEIGIWEDSDFDLDNTDSISDNEYNSQE
ncbi:24006_t:CDS:2, partial [Gigaspora margarita]